MADDILQIEAWRPWRGHLVIHRGETFDPRLEWSDDAGPIDWTGYGAECVISGSNSLSLATGNGGLVLGSDGGMVFWLDDEATAILKAAKGTFKLWLTEPGGKRRLFGAGTVAVD